MSAIHEAAHAHERNRAASNGRAKHIQLSKHGEMTCKYVGEGTKCTLSGAKFCAKYWAPSQKSLLFGE